METEVELPQYRSHKVVRAAKIDSIDGQVIGLATGGMGSTIVVAQSYLDKHQPTVGGYYVKYADGYESFSPAQAFEEGNTLLITPEPDHASDVLYPAIKAAMTELESLHAGFSMEVNRAYNHLHGAFWSECPRPANMPDLRATTPATDAPSPT